ncbi:hypothetical protein NAPIS_ORF00540 [Vairimorpha apis BRL 01]|uniref:Leucine-rich repeat protein n=1 Tax=Vairimorpha apis BRL 01 TaxID=1037528 RepID=T0MLF0_9MICR|nr:hypothetical protein NAPIS_ORF00540 [Vairimorpha apis BRL 01]
MIYFLTFFILLIKPTNIKFFYVDTTTQELNLSNQNIVKLDEFETDITNLTNLYVLNMRKNFILNLPSEIKNNKKLKILNLNDNLLSELPTTINELKLIEILDVSNNYLTSITLNIFYNNNLNILLLNNNFLCEINHLTSKPSNVKILNLGSNYLRYIPNTISNFIQLKIGYIKNLKQLNLRNNLLTKIPSSVLNLKHSIEFINLSGNPIDENGCSNFFGKFELSLIFGNKIIFEDQIIFDSKFFLTDAWNNRKIYVLENTLLPDVNYSYKEILKLWNSCSFNFFKKYIKKFCQLNEMDILDLISKNTNSYDFKIFMVDKFDVNCIFENSVIFKVVRYYRKKIYLENFLYYLFNYTPNKSLQSICLKCTESFNFGKYIQDYVNKKIVNTYSKKENSEKNLLEESVELIERYLEVMYKKLLFCPSKQILEFKLYHKLISNNIYYNITIVDAIEIFIGELKLNIFDAICISEIKILIWNKLISGDVNLEKNLDLELYNRILKKFYSIFTPYYTIIRLYFWINNDKKLLKLVKDWMLENFNILTLPKNLYFCSYNENIEDIKNVSEILIREILIKMHLIVF